MNDLVKMISNHLNQIEVWTLTGPLQPFRDGLAGLFRAIVLLHNPRAEFMVP